MTSEDDHGSGPDRSERPVVVLVPGLGLDAREWRAVRAALPGRHEVTPLPSLGLPSGRGCDLHVEAQAERLLRALPAGRAVVLVGHSAGCPVAVEVATRTSRVAGLVLVGPVTDPRAVPWPRTVLRWLRTARHERPWEVRVLAPQYRDTGVRSILRGNDRARWYRTDVAMGAVSVPVHVVRGEHDRIAPLDWCLRLAGAGAGAGVVVSVPTAGHMVPLTHPEAVVASVRALLATADATGRSGDVAGRSGDSAGQSGRSSTRDPEASTTSSRA